MGQNLFTMQGPAGNGLPPGFPDPRELDDESAGVHYFATVAALYPGITFNELLQKGRMNSMGGWLTDLGKAVMKPVHAAGDMIGSAVRLVTDPKVAAGAGQIGAAIATGGGSTVLQNALGGGQQGSNLLSQIGSLWKQAFGGGTGTQVAAAGATDVPKWVLPVGAGVLGVGFLAWVLKRK